MEKILWTEVLDLSGIKEEADKKLIVDELNLLQKSELGQELFLQLKTVAKKRGALTKITVGKSEHGSHANSKENYINIYFLQLEMLAVSLGDVLAHEIGHIVSANNQYDIDLDGDETYFEFRSYSISESRIQSRLGDFRKLKEDEKVKRFFEENHPDINRYNAISEIIDLKQKIRGLYIKEMADVTSRELETMTGKEAQAAKKGFLERKKVNPDPEGLLGYMSMYHSSVYKEIQEHFMPVQKFEETDPAAIKLVQKIKDITNNYKPSPDFEKLSPEQQEEKYLDFHDKLKKFGTKRKYARLVEGYYVTNRFGFQFDIKDFSEKEHDIPSENYSTDLEIIFQKQQEIKGYRINYYDHYLDKRKPTDDITTKFFQEDNTDRRLKLNKRQKAFQKDMDTFWKNLLDDYQKDLESLIQTVDILTSDEVLTVAEQNKIDAEALYSDFSVVFDETQGVRIPGFWRETGAKIEKDYFDKLVDFVESKFKDGLLSPEDLKLIEEKRKEFQKLDGDEFKLMEIKLGTHYSIYEVNGTMQRFEIKKDNEGNIKSRWNYEKW